jgi:hypothetical protein
MASKGQGSNSVRPWARVLVAFRDDGICQYCNKPITNAGNKRQIKIFDSTTETKRKGAVVDGDYTPAIDHLLGEIMDDSSTGRETDGNKVRYTNLSLVHKICNSVKAEKGGMPTPQQEDASLKWIDPKEVESELLKMGYGRAEISDAADRGGGRTMFREVAATLGRRHVKEKPAKAAKAKKSDPIEEAVRAAKTKTPKAKKSDPIEDAVRAAKTKAPKAKKSDPIEDAVKTAKSKKITF